MKKLFKMLCLIFTAFVFVIPTNAIEEIKSDDIYYLGDCIKIGIENSPKVKKAKLEFEMSKSDYQIAKSGYFPNLGVGVGFYQFVNSTNNYDDGYWKRTYPMLGVYLEQLIFDFGKTNANINMEKFYRITAEYRYNDSICEVINNVQMAYFNVLEAMAVVEVEKNNKYISEMIVNKTKELYKNGKKPETDYINAKVYLAGAKIRLEDAINTYNKAIADLCNAMYADIENIRIKSISEFNYYDAYFSPDFIQNVNKTQIKKTDRAITDFHGDIKKLPFSLQDAYELAQKNNPELRALENIANAIKQYALVIKREIYPQLKASVSYGHDGKYISQKDAIINDQFKLTVTLDSSVNIMRKKNELNKINLMIESAENDINLFKQNIHFEIKKAYMDVETAQRQIINAKDKVKHTIENLNSVNKDYNSGKDTHVGFLELQNARQNYNDAKLQYIEKLKLYNISLARLEKITHIHANGMNQYKDMHSLCDDKSHNHPNPNQKSKKFFNKL